MDEIMMHPQDVAVSVRVKQPHVISSSDNSASSSGGTDVDADSNANVHCGFKVPQNKDTFTSGAGAAKKDTNTTTDMDMFSPVKSKSSSIPAHIKAIISTPSTIDMNQSADTLDLGININANPDKSGDGDDLGMGIGMSMDMDNVSSISSDSDGDREDKGDRNDIDSSSVKGEDLKMTSLESGNVYVRKDEADEERGVANDQHHHTNISMNEKQGTHTRPRSDDSHNAGLNSELNVDIQKTRQGEKLNSGDQQHHTYSLGLPPSHKRINTHMNTDMGRDENGNVSTSATNLNPPPSPRAMQSQLRVYEQIVTSLTEENNALRVKDVTQMIKIKDLEIRINSQTNSTDTTAKASQNVDERAKVQVKVQEMQRSIDDKNDMISSILKKNTSLTEEYDECQVKIADLGQKVIQMERELHSVQLENETLQKLLRTNRDAVMNLSLSTSTCMENENSYSLDDSTHMNMNRSGLDMVANVNVSVRSDEGTNISANVSTGTSTEMMGVLKDGQHHQVSMLQEPVIQSLKNELEVTKAREQDLRNQLAAMAKDQSESNGGDGYGFGSTTIANKDTIMEKLSESQQEAIIYLNREVSDLRDKLEEERKKMASHLEASKTHREKIEVLEYENKLAVEETIKNEKLLEVTQQDLSIKLGENACYRDEIAELEGKARRVDQLNQELIEIRREREELEVFKTATEKKAAAITSLVSVGTNTMMVSSLASLPQESSHSITPKHKRTSSEYSDMNMDDATLITVEIDGDHDGIETDVFASARTLSDHRQFSVLKKALKAKYEKKQKDLEKVLEEKEAEIGRLSSCLEDQQFLSQKQVEEIQDIEMRRISHEAEMNEELENLRMSYKERSLELLALKEKMKMSHDKKSRSTGERAWKHLSDTLIDGVAASIEIFESMSFQADEVEKREVEENVQTSKEPVRPAPCLRSAKSFG